MSRPMLVGDGPMTEWKTIRSPSVARMAGLAVVAALVALSGCAAPPGESGQPGTVSVHMDGRVATYAGAMSNR
jgi:hypothetical protein